MKAILSLVLLVSALAVGGARADDTLSPEHRQSAAAAWQLLDYLAVDYGGAVRDGVVIDAGEYAEMVEFAGLARERIAALPAGPAREALIADAEALAAAIGRKASPAEVSRLARALADGLLAAYPVALAPSGPPDAARGAALYSENCASCHGAEGRGDGPLAAGMEPPPVDFTDASRARERSLYALYSVISRGLDGTPMPSFSHLAPEDRWALAFHVGGLAFSAEEAEKGARLWRERAELRDMIPDLDALVKSVPALLAETIGAEDAQAVTAWLRHHPEALLPPAAASLARASTLLDEARTAYESGRIAEARQQALAAYLDGFELVEPALKVRDPALMRRIEAAMAAVRRAITDGVPAAEVATRIDEAQALINSAARLLGSQEKASAVASFVGALTILLREGVEALLVVVAMIAFLAKSGRRRLLAYVHGGWIAALVAGGATWAVATHLVAISGAGRELSEGVGGLLAAVILVSVGIWMHGKSHAEAWQEYISRTMTRALSRKSAWFLFFLSFLVVYREAFETILFYAALWSEGAHQAVAGGAGAGALALVVIAWAFLRYSRRLPIRQFFLLSAWLMAILAVVLAGKGVAALQEAGWIGALPLAHLPRIDVIGFYPTWQGVAVQLLTILVLLLAFHLQGRRHPARAAG
ncbi:MAG: iron permease [Alphaproteobacteria bacterium]|nr:MAG: iron permease [Alphaproteobacteria bacterium]